MPGLYIHIPFCASKCAYCDFPSWQGREGHMGRYIDALLREARLCARSAPRFTTAFIGGGTPSLLPAGLFTRLAQGLGEELDLTALEEFTLEANPGTLDGEKLGAWRAAGVSRLSFGLQAAQSGLLQAIGRIHTYGDFERAVAMAREEGFTNINADMLTGLPGQTVADAAQTARLLCGLGLGHVSCYALKLEEGTPLRRRVAMREIVVPGDDEERAQAEAAREVLQAHGLMRYEISNYALPGCECRHNLLYWLRGEYLGLGVGAASFLRGVRGNNRAGLDQYMLSVEEGERPLESQEEITPKDAAFEHMMLGLRLTRGVNMDEFEAQHGFNPMRRWAQALNKHAQGGLVEARGNVLRLTPRGMDLQNVVLVDLM